MPNIHNSYRLIPNVDVCDWSNWCGDSEVRYVKNQNLTMKIIEKTRSSIKTHKAFIPFVCIVIIHFLLLFLRLVDLVVVSFLCCCLIDTSQTYPISLVSKFLFSCNLQSFFVFFSVFFFFLLFFCLLLFCFFRLLLFLLFSVFFFRLNHLFVCIRLCIPLQLTMILFDFSWKQGKDLPAKDLSGTSDPYVRVTLLPDKKHRLETKIKRRTLNPRWNETFYFEGFPIQKLNTRVLHLHVFDYDRFSRDDSIGEVFLPLCQVSVLFFLKFVLF